jgi:hypothetical protein
MATDLSTMTEPGDELRRLEALFADKIDARRLLEWIRPLNAACSRPEKDEDALRARVAAILGLLGDLPAAAFTLESARRVRAVGFPSATAIRTAVNPAVKAMADEIARAKRVGGGDAERPQGWAARWAAYYRARMNGEVAAMPPPNEAHLLSLVRTQSPAAFDMIVGAAAEGMGNDGGNGWWRERIRSRFEDAASPDFHRNPTMRWREAEGMLAVLTRPDAHVKQWAVDRLVGIMRQAEDEGADTSQPGTRPPLFDMRRPAAGIVKKIEAVPFSDRGATQAAREAALPAASIFGDPEPMPRRGAISAADLAAAYRMAGLRSPRPEPAP